MRRSVECSKAKERKCTGWMQLAEVTNYKAPVYDYQFKVHSDMPCQCQRKRKKCEKAHRLYNSLIQFKGCVKYKLAAIFPKSKSNEILFVVNWKFAEYLDHPNSNPDSSIRLKCTLAVGDKRILQFRIKDIWIHLNYPLQFKKLNCMRAGEGKKNIIWSFSFYSWDYFLNFRWKI